MNESSFDCFTRSTAVGLSRLTKQITNDTLLATATAGESIKNKLLDCFSTARTLDVRFKMLGRGYLLEIIYQKQIIRLRLKAQNKRK